MTSIHSIKQTIAQELQSLNSRMTASLDSSNPMMNQVITNYMQAKGKQLRPMLVILTAKIFGKVTDRVIAAAAAVELLHNASLIHDDVVDNSPLRHGRPTVNAVWDNHIAVLVGDYFVSTALREAIFTDDIRVIDTIGRLGQMLSVGEMDQIYNARFHTLDEEAYFEIISHKTASLFISCVRMGCFTVGASDADLEKMMEYARLFGLCFQIRDDIYDYFSDDAIGKPTGNDLREGKVTLPLLYALNRTDHPRHDEMIALSRREQLSEQDIDTLITFAKECGGIEYAFETMQRLSREAGEILATLPDCPETRALATLIDTVIAR